MEYLVVFLSLLLYFWQRHGLFIFVPLVYSIGYLLLGWIGVKTRILRLGLTLLCVPILFWSFLFRRSFFMAEDASEFWAMAVSLWHEVLTASPTNPWIICTTLSMAAGSILCSMGISKKRRTKQRQSAAS
ncbi:hypothetical protein RT97_18090 [Variovorax paradoxus]|uniref:Transmembrane protein n=1 Tax=Variovorax paradoxus TaxID=34073 RepID=A0A0D0ML48_VARPD|nr:hypothetical protein [Variovorax paradoxus]KIQ30055.1 hypothetical protein RT97_18090 [Variovorax paradoxus]